jgi:hypothetical protein
VIKKGTKKTKKRTILTEIPHNILQFLMTFELKYAPAVINVVLSPKTETPRSAKTLKRFSGIQLRQNTRDIIASIKFVRLIFSRSIK